VAAHRREGHEPKKVPQLSLPARTWLFFQHPYHHVTFIGITIDVLNSHAHAVLSGGKLCLFDVQAVTVDILPQPVGDIDGDETN
jgi:hypothetical protein